MMRRIVIWAVVLLLAGEAGLRVAGHLYEREFWRELAEERAAARDHVIVLALGESTTKGIWLSDSSHSYPKQLQALLREHYSTDAITVLRPPHIGQNTSQMLNRCQHYLDTFKPAVVLIMAGANNSWSLSESNLGQFLDDRGWSAWWFRARVLLDEIRLFKLFRMVVYKSGRVIDELQGKPLFTPWPPPGRHAGLHPNDEPFLKLWRHDVGAMVRMAQEAGAAAVLMTYPNYISPPISEFRQLSQALAIPLVDNYAMFREYFETGTAEQVFFGDMQHPNREGYGLLAENALKAIVQTEAIQTARAGVE